MTKRPRISSISVPGVAETACNGHQCDLCGVCRRGSCCRRDREGWRLPELGSWPGEIFGQLGVLARDAEGAQCHICGRVFRMLATHVWRTHAVWADEYRAYFGLSAKRGLAGTETSAKLSTAAAEYLVPHHWWPDTVVLRNELRLRRFEAAPDVDAVENLLQLRGLGLPVTADAFVYALNQVDDAMRFASLDESKRNELSLVQQRLLRAARFWQHGSLFASFAGPSTMIAPILGLAEADARAAQGALV